jgi:hypothetical protein
VKRLLLLGLVAACGDNLNPDYKSGDQDPFFRTEGQSQVGAYGLDKLTPETLQPILRRIDGIDNEVLVLYGHATPTGVSVQTIEAVLARARDRGLDSVTFLDLARDGANRPGIALSFDDTEIDAWFEFRDVFARFDARATFFVTRYHEWSDDARAKLHVLFDEGHSIEAHGVNHVNVCLYAETHGLAAHDLDAYIAEEVMPSVEVLRADGFTPHAFAFPGGIEGNEIIDALAPHIEITRGITQRPAK